MLDQLMRDGSRYCRERRWLGQDEVMLAFHVCLRWALGARLRGISAMT